MIKQIQLRGISHKPSDRLTADGGLEDCIDLRLEEQEHASAKAPENVTDTLAPGLSDAGMDVIYIHKTNSYTNYIGVKKSGGHNYLYAYHNVSDTWSLQQIVQLPEDEYPKGITSIGNIVIASTEVGSLYMLYRDDVYKYLGDKIPRPVVYFYTDSAETATEKIEVDSEELAQAYQDETGSLGVIDPYNLWTFALTRKVRGDETGILAANFYGAVYDGAWNYISATRKQKAKNDIFCAPVFVRYAVRLYDGTYVHMSEPILLASTTGTHSFFIANLDSTGKVFVVLPSIQSTYKTQIKIQYNPGEWSELIESVDVFASPDILTPNMYAEFEGATRLTDGMSDPTLTFPYNNISLDAVGDADPIKSFDNEIAKTSNFYRISSYKLKNLPNYDYMTPYAQDDLVVLPRLEENDAHTISAAGAIGTYNNRLLTGDQIVTLSPGHDEPQCLQNMASTVSKFYVIYYHVRDIDGNEHLVKGYISSGIERTAVKAYVSYPDARCYQADLYVGNSVSSYTTKVILPMKEHPFLNVAYGYWGVDKPLDTPDGDSRSSVSVSGLPDADLNPTYEIKNRMLMSEMDNPFTFPLGQRVRFSAEIIAALPVTTALSTGQFGQFPLYVFTQDGIYSVSINDEGEVLATHPVSRDVAYPGSIAQLDQAIVFISRQGVMLLSGSDTSLLSPYMDGQRYELEDVLPNGSAIRAALSTSGWGSLIDIALDTTDFRDFIDGCRPLYDYANRRILFFNEEEDYAYEYALDSQTWHRLSVPDTFVRALNGYPQSYAVMGDDIYEWSVQQEYNEETPQARKGIILTRAMDLGDPDIRKVVHDLRIRGTFNRGDIKYLMFGSSDGIHWHRLLTKGGGSYNLFRFLILANMTPGERISWIDVEYDRRFLNKLR